MCIRLIPEAMLTRRSITKDQEKDILIPGNYYSEISKYSWNLQTQPIPGLQNRWVDENAKLDHWLTQVLKIL